MNKQRILKIAKFAVPALVAVLVILYAGVSYLAAAGVTRAEREEQADHPSDYGIAYEDVKFLSRKGDVTLDGWFLPAESRGPSVILVHGISTTRSGRQATQMGGRLVEHGFNVLLFDLRAHGASEGEMITGGIDEAQDVLGGYDYLLSRGLPDRVGLLGRSMGAGTAVLAAAAEPRVKGLVLDSTYAKATELVAFEVARKTPIPQWLASTLVPGMSIAATIFFGINLGDLTPERVVKDIRYPILLFHGRADTRVPVEHGIRVYEAAPPGSEILLVPGVNHVDLFNSDPEMFMGRVVPYFRERLGP